ncbi:hypothetical protein CHH83_02625 [Bacillus sp. 7586-K]|nr:hypothetical protein CHH83_02625 [Bacillus sp. 7586-K]
MGLITKTVKVKWNSKICKHYKDKGYQYTKIGEEFEVKVEDLTKSSNVLVDVECDGSYCRNDKVLKVKWQDYLKCVKKDGSYYCQKCSNNLFGRYKRINKKLMNGKSIATWCNENGYVEILERWDYFLNKQSPDEININSQSKYYLTCPNGKHNSELKNIYCFSRGESNIQCECCNSFAQWGINNLGEGFLEDYWDYEKNDDLGIDPWKVSKGSEKKVWIICQEKDYHKSYCIMPKHFTKNGRCYFCAKQRTHYLDSIGNLYNEIHHVWSDKNQKTPYNYLSKSNKYVWWKCPSGKHKDFRRKISVSTNCDFRCPSCEFSKGEKEIEKYLITNNITFHSQKEFNGLLGTGGGLLSYDFYLPSLNLLIEYQGEFHDGTAHIQSEKDFLKQREHDKRKREYAKSHNIDLLEIWYWDFDNIEGILINKLNI